jgi:MYXO-CTERM domain-containing protein
LFAGLSIVLVSTALTQAAIIFTAPTATVGGSLVITSAITLTATATNSARFLILDNWVTSDGGFTLIGALSPLTLSYSINSGSTQTVGSLQLADNRGLTVGNVTPGDGIFVFASVPVTSGQTFTILPANFTTAPGAVAGFNPLANQTFTGNVFLADASGVRISDIVAVPEPSSALLGLSGLTALALRRRRN